MVDIALMGTGFVLGNSAVLNLGILLIGANGINYLIFENRYPYFYQLVAREEKQQKYKKSLIQGLSKEKIIARLQELMEDEKILPPVRTEAGYGGGHAADHASPAFRVH